jgi:hypothetical protein
MWYRKDFREGVGQMTDNHDGKKSSKMRAQFLLLLAAGLVLTACEGVTRISEVKQDPSKFRNKTVRVMGTVINSVGVMSTGGYEIEDNTGKIFVISNQGIPARGAKVMVEGTVFSGAMVLGQAVGVSIKETRHQLR